MNFLTPLFMIGLGALAVPLLIHLIRRERNDAVEFPSLMFLSRIPQPVVKRRHIRNWWLFVLRCLALILLVSAFARPFVKRAPDAIAVGPSAREVVILLDRSYSMGYGDRWERAVAAAREAIDGLGPNDRASLVFFDVGAKSANQPTNDKAKLRNALDSAKVGTSVTRYTPALKLAQNVLAVSELPTREAVMISDFQRAGWEGAAGAQLPAGATLRTVMIRDGDVPNILVTSVKLDRTRVSGRDRIVAIAQIMNRGTSAVRVPVTFEADGRVLQTVPTDVPANEVVTVTMQPVTLDERYVQASVRAGEDALKIDNAFHFVLAPASGLRVLIVEPPGRDASLYVRRALELADDPPFEVRVKRDGMPTTADLERTDVVLMNDVLPPEGEAGKRLVEWVRAGGGALLATGDRTANSPWGANARALAGGAPGDVVDRVDDGGARLGYLDYSHPVFELFRAPHAGAFGVARFYRYRPVPSADARPDGADSTAAAPGVLARFDDGTAALLEHPVGAGRVLVWGSTLDAFWTNLALEPVFLPLVHQMTKRAAGFSPARAWSVSGQIVDVGSGDQPLLINTPLGERVDVEAGLSLVALDQVGFYEVREARAGGSTLRSHAVNVDVTESDLTPLDPKEVEAAAVTTEADTRANTSSTLPPAEQEKRQALWWYLLITVFALLTAEAVFANRPSRRAA